MAKQKFEITTFTSGINGSVSETDIQEDAASYSTNISAIAEDGALRGINDDQVLSSEAGFQTLSKHKQTLTVLCSTNDETLYTIAGFSAGTNDVLKIQYTGHGLVDDDVIYLTGTAGTSYATYSGYYSVTLVDANYFTIRLDYSDIYAAGLLTAGKFTKVRTTTGVDKFQYTGIPIIINTIGDDGTLDKPNYIESNHYAWFKQGSGTAIGTTETNASATVTITDYSHGSFGPAIEFIAYDGTVVTATAHADTTTIHDTTSCLFDIDTSNNVTAENLRICLDATSKFTATRTDAVVTITQIYPGSNGNTLIQHGTSSATGWSKTDFANGAPISDPATGNTELDGYTGIPVVLDTSNGHLTNVEVASLLSTAIHNSGLTSSVTESNASSSVTITDFTELNPGDKVNLIASDGTNYDFVNGDQSSVAGTWASTGSNNTTATNLMNVINTSSGPSGARFTATVDGAVVTVTQATKGAVGNTVVTLTDSGTVGMTKTNFTGGTGTGVITIEANKYGKCKLAEIGQEDIYTDTEIEDLDIDSNIITTSIVTQGYGSIFKSDDMTIIKEDKDIFTLFSIDYSANTIFQWKDIYNTTSTLRTFQENVVHNNASHFSRRDQSVHIGLGNGESFKTKWIGKIDRAQLSNKFDDWYIEDDELVSLPESMAPLNFDVMTSNQIHDNMIAFNEQQSYHADVAGLDGATLQAAFESGGKIFIIGTGTRDENTFGKTDNATPGIGWCFKITNIGGADQGDTTGNDLIGFKKAYYDNDASGGDAIVLAVGDVFMVVDNVAASVKLEYIGSTVSKQPAFFIGATEGSNIVYKVSSTYKTDSDADFVTDLRYTQLDLTDVLDDSGIMTIAPCRSPLTSGYTSNKAKYICYGDGTIDAKHIADQRCRALHMVYWISTQNGNFYRINLMDFHSLNSDDDYKGAKQDALMVLDYSQIGKCQNSTYDGNFKHWFGAIYGTTHFSIEYPDGGSDVSSAAFDSVTWVDNYAGSWSNYPVNSNIVGIIETWNNSTEGFSTCTANASAARYVYDDDSDAAGAGANHYPSPGYMDHHHARKHTETDFWTFNAGKTMNVTYPYNHGVDVGNILTGFIQSNGDGHVNYEGNTICNRVTGINDFTVAATHPGGGGSADEFPYYSCKVWVLFRRKDNSPYTRWDLMLYNFYPTQVSDNTATMYDRTPPYDEVDKAPHPDTGDGESEWWNRSISNVNEHYAVMQKSSQVCGNENGLQAQDFTFPGSNIDGTAYVWGVIRRDGSAVSYHIRQDSLRNYDFGRIIGWDGSETQDNIRTIIPTKHTLTNVYDQDETMSSRVAATFNEDENSTDWDHPVNKHQVTFIGRTSGDLALEGISAYYRSTEGTKHINMHSGAFKNYNNVYTAYKITDNASAPQDTRMWMAHYPEDDSSGYINEELAWHYSAGGRFKKRVIIDVNGTVQSIRGSGKTSGSDNLYKLGTDYSLYDGTRITDKRLKLSNGSSTMYAGQIGDYLYIDRKWLSSEAKVGTTHIRENNLAAKCVESYHESNVGYYRMDCQVRYYDSGGTEHTKIRGNDGYYHRNNSGLSNSSGVPSGNYTGHEMSSRNQCMLMTRIVSAASYSASSVDGDENLYTEQANEGNNMGSGNTLISGNENEAFDMNRYPNSFEIIMKHACEMRVLNQSTGAFSNVRAVQNLHNNNMYYDNRLMISASIINNNETESLLTTQAFSTRPAAEWLNNYQSTYIPESLVKLHKTVLTEYAGYPKIIARSLTPVDDIASNYDYADIWVNGSTIPGGETSINQFIAPLAFDNAEGSHNGYDWGNASPHFDAILSGTSAYTIEAALVEITGLTASGGSTEFPANSNIKYKLSLLYDGYQESPLSNFFYDIDISSTAYAYATITMKILNTNLLSKRVSHINLYRKNTNNDLYRLVKQIDLDPSKWATDTNNNNILSFRDDKRFASYSALNGINENVVNTSLNYELSASINDSLFVAKAWHPEIEDSNKYLFKSKPGNFSQFDYTKDYLVLNSIPVAIAAFAGKIWAFDRSNTYRINPDGMFVEDTFDGVGCLSQDALVVTEFGMCFADSNNIYLHDGSTARPIGNPILNVTTYEGLVIGWQAAVEYSENTVGTPPFVFYDGESNSFVCFVHGSCEETCGDEVSRAWVFNISRNRWDYWEAPKALKAVQGKDGDILLTNNNFLYNYKKDTILRDWKWLSKKLSITKVTNDKRFHRVHMLGNPNASTLSTPPKWNDDVVVYVDGEIQQLSILTNKYTKSFSGCFLDYSTKGPNWLNDSTTTLFVVGRSNSVDTFLGLIPTINSYILIDSEVMLVTARDLTADIIELTVTRGQLGSSAVAHTISDSSGEGYEGQRIFNIAPTIKLPAKCKGKNIEIMLQNQKGVVDSIMIDFIDKGTV